MEWMNVRIKDPAHPGPNDEEVQGRYCFKFNYDAATGRWVLERDKYLQAGTHVHMQQADETGRRWNGRFSRLTYTLINDAVDRAQADPASTKPVQTTRPAGDGRNG